jgi:Tfp pilus assembly protein PilV
MGITDRANIKRDRHTIAGISLIEVLAVIVLLVVGIFSVIQLFPPGFLVNRQSEEATIAGRLASQEMDSWKNAASNLPDAIIPVVYEPSTGGFKVDLNTTPNDLSPSSYPNADVAYYSSDINKVRRIIGETVRIPIASPTYAGRGSIYVLRAGPFLDVSWDGRTRSLFVSGAPLRRSVQEVSASDSPSLFNPSRYAIDYDDAQIAFYPVPYPREFLISYS